MSTNPSSPDSDDTRLDSPLFSSENLFNLEASEESLRPAAPELIGFTMPFSEFGDIPLPGIDPDLGIALTTADEAAFDRALAKAKLPPLELSRTILRWIIAREGFLTLLPAGAAKFTLGAYRVEFSSEDVAPTVTVFHHGAVLVRTAR